MKALAESFTSEIVNSKETRMLAALTAQSPCAIQDNYKPTKTARKSALLPSAIRRSLSIETNATIMFTSAYVREGAPDIAFQVARAAAIQSTGKILYIHVSRRTPRFFRDIGGQIPIDLEDFVKAGGGSTLPFVLLQDSGLVCACLSGSGENVSAESMKVLIAALRKCFELTVIGGDNLLADGASIAFSDLVDGTILVAEAEHTRAPVARRLKRSIEENGGKVLGAILNRREYHIPEWIYQLLYGGY